MQYNRNARYTLLGGLLLGSVTLLSALTACSREPSAQAVVAAQPPPPAALAQPPSAPPATVLVQTDVVMPDDYVYYPQYEVYYSSSRSRFGYWDGGAWLWRPAPPNVAANVVFASASVRMDFHDSPALHRESVARSYPRNWAGSAKAREPQGDRRETPRDDRNDRR